MGLVRWSGGAAKIAWTLMPAFLCASCSSPFGGGADAGGNPPPLETPAPSGSETGFSLSSPAFENGATIPTRYTCEGDDTSPPLTWTGLPAATASLALEVEDPDAPSGSWIHWIVFNLPLEISELPAEIGEQPNLGGLGESGSNSWGETRYGGPCPPSGTHRYFFHLYALDQPLDLPAGASQSELHRAMEGHILAEATLLGTYTKSR
ncbi:MAG: YbhB/YbcL family Raf kinase inhibitor-like protein [Anaerolineales bacterium]